MTREDAIRKFKGIIGSFSISIAQADFYPSKAELNELCNMAIKALQGDMYCPNCGVRLVQEDEYLEPTQTHGRLIDADALMKELSDIQPYNWTESEAEIQEDADYSLFKSLINSAPTVQADRPHGEWIEREDWNGDSYYDCSVCGESFVLCDGTPSMNLYHYCPNCGADMRKEKP